jgi:Nucleotidyl transferase AbiEii toxin, Type IV TA system
MARGLIRQVNSEGPVIDRWTFGGGTALMLHIGHRESRDVDIFLEDAQFLPFLDPQKRDFKFDILPSDYGAAAQLNAGHRGASSVDDERIESRGCSLFPREPIQCQFQQPIIK